MAKTKVSETKDFTQKILKTENYLYLIILHKFTRIDLSSLQAKNRKL